MLEQKERLERELKALRRDAGVHAKHRAEFRALHTEIRDKEKQQKQLERKVPWSESSDQIVKAWDRCRKLNHRLTRVGPLLDIPKHLSKRVIESFAQVQKLRKEWEQISAERKRIKEKAAKYRGRDSLYQHAAEIHALDRQRERIVSLDAETKRAQDAVEELELELSAEMETLGVQAGTKADRLPNISDEIIEALRGPARETKDLREAAEQTRKLAESYRQQAEKVKSDLEAAAKRFGVQDIAIAHRQRVGLIKSLEQRLGLDERRDGLVRQIEELEEEASYWNGRSVLPWKGILAVCGVFSFGGMLILAGLLNSWFDEIQARSLIPLVTIGSALSAISLVIKNTLEGSAAERADLCQQQILIMQEDHAEALEKSQAIDGKLKDGAGEHPDQRLIDAQEQLLEIQEYLPLAERHETLTREAEAAEHQATAAVRMLKESRRGWKASLRTVGLPESLTPSQIGEMQGRVTDVTRLRQRLDEAKKTWEDRRDELRTVRERIEQLLLEADIIEIPDALNPQLQRLVAELEKHTRSGREREQLKQRWEELHAKQQRLAQQAQKIVSNRRRLLDTHGIPSMAEFHESRQQSQKCRKMRKERDRRLQQIVELTNGDYTLDRLQSMLDQKPEKLVDRLQGMRAERQALEEELAVIKQRADGLRTKIDEQMQDRRCDHKELALQCVEEQLSQQVQAWQKSALISSLLEQVKKNYETKRQPVALAEASTHLERLTEGRYTRIWTPMGQESLCVDDHRGQALPVEKLSRGTRELVFLALRLALVNSYARRGANMPIVLDDVFVNFDDQRAQAVAQVLADIAQGGQQMLIFTCHERIRSIFHQLGHDVRDLPLREGIQARMPSPLNQIQAETQAPTPPVPEEIEPPADVVTDETTSTEVTLESNFMEPDEDDVEPELPPPPQEEVQPRELQPTRKQRRERYEFERFTPAWRDEWLEPLPDIAPSGDADDADAWY